VDQSSFKYVFGPAMSRRLGRSLGVDLVPFKTCTYNCIYCQLGATTCRTVERREYVPLDELVDEVRRKLAAGVEADYITLAGSGEPTLYSRLGELIDAIKAMASIPVALLTNGSLFWISEVREEAAKADLVIPSLDAGDDAAFRRVNQACPEIGFDRMVEGLADFRAMYPRPIWLEVFLLKGITDGYDELGGLIVAISRIRPDKVQLNTVARPTPGFDVAPVAPADLEHFAREIERHTGCPAEVVAHSAPANPGHSTATPEDVLGLVRRHPCSLRNLAEGLGIGEERARRLLDELLAQGAITEEFRDAEACYLATP